MISVWSSTTQSSVGKAIRAITPLTIQNKVVLVKKVTWQQLAQKKVLKIIRKSHLLHLNKLQRIQRLMDQSLRIHDLKKLICQSESQELLHQVNLQPVKINQNLQPYQKQHQHPHQPQHQNQFKTILLLHLSQLSHNK